MTVRAEVQIERGVAIIIVGDRIHFDGLKLVRDHAIDALGFYHSLFGFYPHSHLLVLAGADRPQGGFPAGSGIVKIHGVNVISERPPDWWAWITAHEIAHMYWGFHVLDAERTATDQLGWLSIGLGLYTDKLYVQARDLDCQFHESQASAFERAREAGKLVRFGISEKEMSELDFDYNTVVRHGRAYSVIRSIATMIGDEPFLRVLKELSTEYAQRELSYDDFRQFVAERTGADLASFVDEYDRC